MLHVTEDLARSALEYVSPDCVYDDWLAIGFALASEFGDAGFHLFDGWSADGKGYSAKGTRAKWKSIVRHASARSSIGVLLGRAKDAGFRFEAAERDEQRARDERERRRAEAEARAAAEEARRRDAAARAAMHAIERWGAASRSGDSLYLRRKGIEGAEAIRFEPDGTVLVPMIRYDLPRDQALVGVQAIRPDGRKLFGEGTAKRGSACRLGLVVEGEPILLAEGYATSATIRMAIDRRLPVFAAFDAGNLEPVAHMLRAQHPRCPLLVCADDDWRTPGNPGRSKAKKITKSLSRTHWVYPVWAGARGDKDTDYNDLQRTAGLAAVAGQLRGPLQLLGGGARRAA